MIYDWHFPSTDGGDEDGINDAGLETFEGDRESFVARECIQNSLDARLNNDEPVRVVFERFNISTASIPARETLKDAICRAKDFASGNTKAEKLYGTAVEILEKDEITILKVSDYNTTGLTGGDDDHNGGWYALVRSRGNSNKKDGGGSFGIGKSAVFATSSLRTVFYSTLSVDNDTAFQGKTMLSSFKNGDDDTRKGVGQYGEKDDQKKGVASIREINGIPEIFQRNQPGTDIFIAGYKPTDEAWAQSLLVSGLDSFWVAIHEGILTVDIISDGKTLYSVNNETLSSLINEYTSDDKHTKLFYESVTMPTRKFEANLALLGGVELYVRVGEGPKYILGMRRPLMKVHEIRRLKVMGDEFVGVFIARGIEGDDNLRELEPPAHNKWDFEKRGEQLHKDAFRNARKWIVGSLKELAGERSGSLEEIPDLSRYLPEDIERDDLDYSASSTGDQSENESDRETADQISAEMQDIKKPSAPTIVDRPTAIKPATAADQATTKQGTHKGKGNGGGTGVTNDPTGKTKHIDTSNMTVRTREAKRNGKRVYIVNILPNSDEAGSIRVMAYGDDGDYEIDINTVTDETGKEYEVKGSEIKGLELKDGQRKELVVELISNRRYALGVG